MPGYLEDLPYLVALIELDEQAGLRLPGRLIDIAPDQVRIGQRMRAEIADLPGGASASPYSA